MKTRILTILLLAFFSVYLNAEYERNPYVPEETWNALTPYFLPFDSKEKKILDRIFSKQRILKSREKMTKTGFLLLTPPEHAIVVAKHTKLKHHIIKAYLDESTTDEAYWFKKRIDGARHVQDYIDRHDYQHIMKVPRKWIYPLPLEPRPEDGSTGKNFILICEKMDIYDFETSRNWYRKKIPVNTVNAIYLILTDCNLFDSVYADNIPYCKDGRIAFVDTEHYLKNSTPIDLEKFTHYFSSKMQTYWQLLISQGGPQ